MPPVDISSPIPAYKVIGSYTAKQGGIFGVVHQRPTEDGGVLALGRLTLWIDDLEAALKADDSLRFNERPYGWRNDSDEPAVVIWVVSPPIY